MPLASCVLFHTVTVFPQAFVLLYADHDIAQVLLLQFGGAVLAVLSVIASGTLSDHYGRPRTLGLCTLCIPLLCLPIPTLVTDPWIYIVFGFALLGLAHGQSSAIAPTRFKLKYRYAGTAMSTSLSWIFGAAFLPLVGLALTASFELWASAGVFAVRRHNDRFRAVCTIRQGRVWRQPSVNGMKPSAKKQAAAIEPNSHTCQAGPCVLHTRRNR